MQTLVSLLRQTGVIWLLVALTSLPAVAALEDEVAGDFKPLDGYVVMKEGGEFIIDLDASHGVQPGEVFAVAGPGKEIIHPVTKKVLGKLESVKGVLKVTRIQNGFSFARALDGADEIRRADPIRRNAILPAVFWDYTGKGESLFRKLQEKMPQLKWGEYHQTQKQRPAEPRLTAATENALIFVLTEDRLEVRDPEFVLMRQYPIGTAASQPTTAPVTPAPAVAVTPDTQKSGAPAATAPVVTPEFNKVQTIATMPNTSLMADFLWKDGTLWIASTNGATIETFQLKNDLIPVASARPALQARILAVHWWVPVGSGQAHITVTTWNDDAVYSLIYRMEDSRLVMVADGISRILGAFDTDGNGMPETLLSQNYDGEEFFGQRISRLELSGSGVRNAPLDLKLPRRFPVIGSLIADLTGDGSPESAFIRNRILFIFNGRERLYKSIKKMGGTLSFLTYDADPSFEQDPKTETAAFELSPLAVDLDGDGKNELVAVASERSMLGTVGIAPGLNKTWVNVFKYADGRFSSGKLGEEFELALQGISLDRKRLLLVATEPGGMMDRNRSASYILKYGLAP
jgi:hypothetical protein